jgi:hypothetical protein
MVVALGSLLLGASAGSWWAGRATARQARWALWMLPVIVLLVSLGLGAMVRAMLGWGLIARVAAAVGVSGLCGAFMGGGFPAGMWAFGARGHLLSRRSGPPDFSRPGFGGVTVNRVVFLDDGQSRRPQPTQPGSPAPIR